MTMKPSKTSYPLGGICWDPWEMVDMWNNLAVCSEEPLFTVGGRWVPLNWNHFQPLNFEHLGRTRWCTFLRRISVRPFFHGPLSCVREINHYFRCCALRSSLSVVVWNGVSGIILLQEEGSRSLSVSSLCWGWKRDTWEKVFSALAGFPHFDFYGSTTIMYQEKSTDTDFKVPFYKARVFLDILHIKKNIAVSIG